MDSSGSRSPVESGSSPLWDDWNPGPGAETVARPPAGEPDRPGRAAAGTEAESGPSRPDFAPRHGTGPGAPTDPGGPGGPPTLTPEGPSRPVVFPKLGAAIGGFRLVLELGRGAFARVYLAHESALGNRPVALKVSKAEGDEPKILARLQHTHIVPIHSLHDDPATGLRLICMPYFGGANLAQVLDAAGLKASARPRGRSLVDALDLVGQPSQAGVVPPAAGRCPASPAAVAAGLGGGAGPAPAPGPHRGEAGHRPSFGRPSLRPRRGPGSSPAPSLAPPDASGQSQPARQFLRESSYVRASAWIAARLAEGLDHAHSRGLLHRDLKPSNILIAADGTPMLLDFNLAAEAVDQGPGDGSKALTGGTLPYMSPEHLDAFDPRGLTPPGAVDERSDIYALGLILFEMVAGRPPFAEPAPGIGLFAMLEHLIAERRRGAPSLRAAAPEVPWSLDAIVAKALAPDPARRYRSARELGEDLRRFLDDRPLAYTPESSVRERLAKWSRRHPRATSAWTIGPLALALTLGVAAVARTQAARLEQVAVRLGLRRFRESLHECQFLLNTASAGRLTDHLRRGVEQARAAIDRYGVARRGDWDRGYWVASLSADERTSLRQDLAELILLEARARVAIAESEGAEEGRRKALEWAVAWLDRVEAFDPAPSPALFADRARYHQALGRADLARLDRARRDATPAASCRDECLLGTADLAEGRFDRAEARLNRAVALDPKRFWAWFARGLCRLDQGRFADAVGDFNVCTVLMPGFAWPFADRGIAEARAGRLAEALASFDRAIELDPNLADAVVGRGLVALELGRPEQAERDLARAAGLGRLDPAVRAGRAEALVKLGRAGEALSLFDDLLADRPGDPRLLAARGMARLATDPAAASADFAAAALADPGLAVAHYGLARCLAGSDRPAALGHADRALGADPGHADARELRALLRARLGRADAAEDVDRLLQAPTPHRLYNAACALAVLARTRPDPRHEARALELLRRAIEAGFPPDPARTDPDLDAIRARPEFDGLVGPPS